MKKLLIPLIGLLLAPLAAYGQTQMQVEIYESNPAVVTYSGTSNSPLGLGFYTIPLEGFDTPFIKGLGGKASVRTYAREKAVTPESDLQGMEDQGIIVIYGKASPKQEEEPTVVGEESDSKIRMATGGLTKTLYSQKGTFGKREWRVGVFLEGGLAQVKTYETLELSDGREVTQRRWKRYRPAVGTGVLIGTGSNLAAHVGYNYIGGKPVHDIQFGIGIRF